MTLLGPATDTAAQLMELGEAEPLRMLDQHDRGVRHVDPDLDHGRRDEHLDLAVPEPPHHGIALLGFHPPVNQPDGGRRQRLLQFARHLDRGLEVKLFGFVDHRIHHVGLAPRRALLAQELIDPRAIATRSDGGLDRQAPARLVLEGRDIEITVQRQREGARDRGRRQKEHVRRPSLLDQRRALLDAEPVLLVDHDQPQSSELGRLLDHRMGSHDDRGLSRGDTCPDRALLAGRQPPEQEVGYDAERSQQIGQGPAVLLGEQLGRSHQNGLVAVLHRQQHGEQPDDRLPGPHVAHQQAMHPRR